jgi:hypothetical protein
MNDELQKRVVRRQRWRLKRAVIRIEIGDACWIGAYEQSSLAVPGDVWNKSVSWLDELK